ncbi:amino acid adenylation domain-containing protein [Pseudomonas citronellolis]|uniref:amino acid adenylation domain-containing protein n=1 Tax=Pseudomonas citronellolis TaxID=53408 RepID=UPI0023E44EDD|nr:amino acid adenylation domain-containing protein [Pseudomonas citronellolis]MDF3934591.1 amino acid adenylation domain-containing protein [Pseudomonas citronellolis]
MQDVRPNPRLPLDFHAERPLFADFVRQARRSPESVAVVSAGATCRYGQLDGISQGIAAWLVGQGVAAQERVLIVSSRCAGLVYAMLGASRAGLVFSVADVAYPAARVDQLVGVLGATCVLLCGEATAEPGRFPPGVKVARVPEAPDEALRQFGERGAPLPAVDPRHPAYITFTSGSTGEPKGVVASHAPLVHFIEWHIREHGLTAADRFSLLSGLGHDPVYRDVFTPLSLGARVVIPAQATLPDPSALARWIGEQGVSVIHLTPPLGKLIETGAGLAGLRLERLRYLFWGGDVLGVALYRQMRVVAPNAVSVNFYGTTETPQAMAHRVLGEVAEGARIPLGKGIDGAQLLVVDESLQLAGEDQVGEIFIRSPYLSLGYWNDAALTAQKYVANPFTGDADDRCYRTGDLGSYLADGSVSFLGRRDGQVKIRGHRIELGEIEAALAQHPGVRQSVVLALQEGANLRLAACCVTAEGVSAGALREHLGARLPDYMVPALFQFLDAIPLTPNGKIDRLALAERVSTVAEEGAQAAGELSPRAARLAKAWAAILEVPKVDARLSFIELGGDSLSFIQASGALEDILGRLPEGWESIAIRDLGELGDGPKASALSLRVMEMPVFIRALAIVLIVIGHFQVLQNWAIAGETAVLFVISGLSLARFQLQAILERDSVRSLFRSIASIAAPTVLYTALVQAVFASVHWQSLLLISNWYPPDMTGGFVYWYIEVLVQMLALIGLALSFGAVRKALGGDAFRKLLGAACALWVAGLLSNRFLFDAAPLYERVPQHFLALVVLGMAIHYANSAARKALASLVAVLLLGWRDLPFLLGQPLPATEYFDVAVPAVLALIWLRGVPLPGLVARGVALVAASTLFIYLTHFQFRSVASRLYDHPLLAVLIAIVGGIAVAQLWNRGVRLLALLWKRSRKKAATAAVEGAA